MNRRNPKNPGTSFRLPGSLLWLAALIALSGPVGAQSPPECTGGACLETVTPPLECTVGQCDEIALPGIPEPYTVTGTATRPQPKVARVPEPFAVTGTAVRPQPKVARVPEPFAVTGTATRPQVKPPELADPFPVTVTADRPEVKPPQLPDPFPVTVTAEKSDEEIACFEDDVAWFFYSASSSTAGTPYVQTDPDTGEEYNCNNVGGAYESASEGAYLNVCHGDPDSAEKYFSTPQLAEAIFAPITVGANSEVGSGGKLREKVSEFAGGALGGLPPGLGGGGIPGLGGSGGGGGGPADLSGTGPGGGVQEPQLATDPVPDDRKILLTDAATGTKIRVGMVPTPHGIQVSSTIVEAPGDGTFQTIYVQDSEGHKAGPIGYTIYELYQDWKLTVTWTYDRWVNGEHVEHREGGWSESGRNILDTFTVPMENDGVWNKLGFSTATQGVKSLGTLFPVGRELLQSTPMTVVIHVTQPDKDPVTTIPFVISVPPCPELPMTVARKPVPVTQVKQTIPAAAEKKAPAKKLDTMCELGGAQGTIDGLTEDECESLGGDFTSF